MIFGQILKNILDKNQSVWIPTVGLLGYDKVSSKLGIDTYGAGTDHDLIHLISEIKQVNAGEAKAILIQEVEKLKSTAINQGKYSIDGLGDITYSNGSYQFESKKTLFPSDFFGGGNFNPSAFKDNASKEESNIFENAFIKVESPKKITPQIETPKIETPVAEKPIVDIPKEEVVQVENNYVEEKEQPKDLFEAAEFEQNKKQESKSIIDSVKDFFTSGSKKAEETIEETTEKVQETVEEWVDKVEEKVEEVTGPITSELGLDKEPEIKEEDFTTRILNEISQDEVNEEIEEDEDEENIEKELESETEEEVIAAPVISKEPRTIVIDEPRTKIGNTRYDEGFYQYDLTLDDDKPNRWPLVAGLSAALLIGGFLLAWIIASFQGKQLLGLNPLWNSKIQDIKKIEPTIAKTDSLKIDSAHMLVKSALADSLQLDSIVDIVSKPSTPIVQNQTTTTKAATPATTAPSKTQGSQTAQTTNKNTPTPKTPTSADPVSKKTVAVATDKNKKMDDASRTKDAASVASNTDSKPSKDKKIKDTTSKSSLAKAPKVNVIGKPYATANYTKGNHYLSFGKFKIASAAVKLKNDMKKKAGIETDIILLDGTYRVVVPYLSRDKAEAASKDYVSTTLFE
jgi:hypothetical protein